MSGPEKLTPHQVLEHKLDYLAEMVGDVHELVEQRGASEQALRIAVRDGIVSAASDPAMWAVALQTLRQQAQAEAGGWLFSGIKSALSKMALVLTIGLLIYLVGGWSALAAFIKSGATHQ